MWTTSVVYVYVSARDLPGNMCPHICTIEDFHCNLNKVHSFLWRIIQQTDLGLSSPSIAA